MEKVLLINTDEPEEIRVALVEDGRLEEVYVEAETDPTGKGNVYVGRVQNVEKGIGAAFVDLGGGVTGFLHVSDISPDATPEATEPVGGGPRKITDLVKPGDPILVQISRGPVGHKGPTLTTRISLPGRYVVLLTDSARSGVSRRIEQRGRDRMRSLSTASTCRPGCDPADGVERPVHRRVGRPRRAVPPLGEPEGRLLEGGGPRQSRESDLISRRARLPPDATRVVCDDAHVAARIREVPRAHRPAAPIAPVAAAGPSDPADADDREAGASG
jgi:hypothetical protein